MPLESNKDTNMGQAIVECIVTALAAWVASAYQRTALMIFSMEKLGAMSPIVADDFGMILKGCAV